MRTIALPKHKTLTASLEQCLQNRRSCREMSEKELSGRRFIFVALVVCRYYVSRGRTSDDAVNPGFERGIRVCRSQGRGLAV